MRRDFLLATMTVAALLATASLGAAQEHGSGGANGTYSQHEGGGVPEGTDDERSFDTDAPMQSDRMRAGDQEYRDRENDR
jgi:hypothetical protein